MCKCAQLEFHRIQTKKTFRALKLNIVINQMYANHVVIIAKFS